MRWMPGLLGALLVLAPLAGAGSLLGPNLCGQLRNRQLEILNELLSPVCQNDGNSGGDAPDTCPANQTFQPFLPKGSAQEGILLPVGDLKDHWLAFVSGRGELLTITMDPAPSLPNSNLLPPDFDVAALTMGCQEIRPVQGGPQQGNLRETIVVPTPFGAPWIVVRVSTSLPGWVGPLDGEAPGERAGPQPAYCDPPCRALGYRLATA